MLTKDRYKRGDQTVVYNENNQKWQVQTWDGNRWYGFVNVSKCNMQKEKTRQLLELTNPDNILSK